MLIPLICLTVRGVQFMEGRFQSESDGFNKAGTRVMVALLSLCIFTFVNYLPWRAIDKYHNYRGMRPDIRYLEKERGFGKSLVLIRGNVDPITRRHGFTIHWILSPMLTVYAWDQNLEGSGKSIIGLSRPSGMDCERAYNNP